FPFPIGQAEAERWLELMEGSLNEFGPDELSDEHREMLWNHMQRVAYMMINR
ncbi:globin, partial [Corynebacterium sanguinis]|nr:globin [Corynebacterium sanguinis]